MDKYLKKSAPSVRSEERLHWEKDLLKFLTTANLEEVKAIIESHTLTQSDFTPEYLQDMWCDIPSPRDEMFYRMNRSSDNYFMSDLAMVNVIIFNQNQDVKDFLGSFCLQIGELGSISLFYNKFAITRGMKKVDFVIEVMTWNGNSKNSIAQIVLDLETHYDCDIKTVRALKALHDPAECELYYIRENSRMLKKYFELSSLVL